MLRTEYNMAPMNEFVGQIVEPEHIAKILDTVLYEYAVCKINETDSGNEGEITSNIWCLKELRDRFRLIAES